MDFTFFFLFLFAFWRLEGLGMKVKVQLPPNNSPVQTQTHELVTLAR